MKFKYATTSRLIGGRQYICKECDMVFYNIRDLRNHLKIRHRYWTEESLEKYYSKIPEGSKYSLGECVICGKPLKLWRYPGPYGACCSEECVGFKKQPEISKEDLRAAGLL